MTPDIVRLYQTLSRLRFVQRFQRQPLAKPQNVAEHSYYVSLLAGTFALQLQERGVPVDRAACIELGLWHDAAEAITSDLPHDFKRFDAELHKLWEQVEDRVMHGLARLAGICPACSPDGLEAFIVKVADWVELLLYVRSEKLMGNLALDVPAERIWKLLDSEPMALKLAKIVSTSGLASHERAVLKWYGDLLGFLKKRVPSPPAVPEIDAGDKDPLSVFEELGESWNRSISEGR
jgi:5'-deoxynucleotidase YfbR-like HD superfamily hydrolase